MVGTLIVQLLVSVSALNMFDNMTYSDTKGRVIVFTRDKTLDDAYSSTYDALKMVGTVEFEVPQYVKIDK